MARGGMRGKLIDWTAIGEDELRDFDLIEFCTSIQWAPQERVGINLNFQLGTRPDAVATANRYTSDENGMWAATTNFRVNEKKMMKKFAKRRCFAGESLIFSSPLRPSEHYVT